MVHVDWHVNIEAVTHQLHLCVRPQVFPEDVQIAVQEHAFLNVLANLEEGVHGNIAGDVYVVLQGCFDELVRHVGL
ncbi:hypothetical protein D3C77_604280 [compost metagenome]